MDQRIYYGNIEPQALADYLTGVFNQPPYYSHHQTMAQKIVQGERIYVQIMHTSDWSGSGHRALGIHIDRFVGGVTVNMGASDWLDLNDTGLAGMLLGILFFPPLLLFPLIQGLSQSTFSQDVWAAIDAYCLQAAPRPGGAPRGFYCSYCGAFNHPQATSCHGCHAPFNFASSQAPEQAEQPAPTSQPPADVSVPPESSPEPAASVEQAASAPSLSLVVCPNCKAMVVPANFCGNCAAPLHEVAGE